MAKFSGTLKAFVEKAKQQDSYWVEETKLQFALALESQRKSAGMTYKAVAEKLGTSAAYITKVFRGDTNVTIESMVKLARATGGELEIKVVDAAAASDSAWAVASLKRRKAPLFATGAVPTYLSQAANHGMYAMLQGSATAKELEAA